MNSVLMGSTMQLGKLYTYLHFPLLDLQSPNIPQVDGHEEIGERECCQYAKQRNSYNSTMTNHTTSPLMSNVISVTRGICVRDHSIMLLNLLIASV